MHWTTPIKTFYHHPPYAVYIAFAIQSSFMSKLRDMKAPQAKDGGGLLYMALAGLVILAFLSILYFYVFVPAPKIDLAQLEGSGHFTGSADAKVRIVEFSDFQCPACGYAHPIVEKVLAEYGDKMKFTYRHFPLANIHTFAQKAAEASECAAEQGKFWEMYDKLFLNQENLKQDDLKTYAAELGLDTAQFNSCIASGKTAARVAADQSFGLSIGVNSTPTFYINGEKFGNMSYEQWKAVIDARLA